MPRRKWYALPAVILLLLLATACQNQAAAIDVTALENPTLTDLTSIDQLQTTFNADSGYPRLLMILAPL